MVVKEIELPDDAEVTLKVVSDPAQYHFYGVMDGKEILLGAHVQNTYLLKLQEVYRCCDGNVCGKPGER